LRRCLISASFFSLTFFTATVSLFSLPLKTAPWAPEPSQTKSLMHSKGISQSSAEKQKQISARLQQPDTFLFSNFRAATPSRPFESNQNKTVLSVEIPLSLGVRTRVFFKTVRCIQLGVQWGDYVNPGDGRAARSLRRDWGHSEPPT